MGTECTTCELKSCVLTNRGFVGVSPLLLLIIMQIIVNDLLIRSMTTTSTLRPGCFGKAGKFSFSLILCHLFLADFC